MSAGGRFGVGAVVDVIDGSVIRVFEDDAVAGVVEIIGFQIERGETVRGNDAGEVGNGTFSGTIVAESAVGEVEVDCAGVVEFDPFVAVVRIGHNFVNFDY